MSKRDPKVTLRQILEHARRVQELSTTTLQVILNDWKLSAAFEREMEILGEAVKRLPADLVARYPGIPWKQIAGTRDRISHGYDETDYNVLWDAACHDVPAVIATVEQMLRDFEKPPAQTV
ncbi:MAG: DUF86 domain-containing protein [Opitutaceae bacterium]|nr:DUF86 domain-containing protein [Opitutaceae bacterium]